MTRDLMAALEDSLAEARGLVVLRCASCGQTREVRDEPVGGRPLREWWESVVHRCAACRAAAPSAPAVHGDGSDTERAAAASVADVTGDLRLRVLGLLRDHPDGLTDDEGGRLMGADRLRFGRRRHELVERGVVVDSGERRATPGGRSAIVWRLAARA